MDSWILSAGCAAGEGELLVEHTVCYSKYQLDEGTTAAQLVDFIMAHNCEEAGSDNGLATGL